LAHKLGRVFRFWAALVIVAAAGCDCGDHARGDRRFGDGDPFKLDAGLRGDADEMSDDTGTSDGSVPDRGFRPDTGMGDTGLDDDTGVEDSGDFDSGDFDTGVVDTGIVDTGVVDTGTFDSGAGTGDLWLEIDYAGAFSPQSPNWSFSNTPGWGASDWAFTGGGCCAEAWDRFNNMSVVSDPIGTSLEINPSAQLQLMFGIVRLTGYTSVTVELEGRSRDTSAGVIFDVTNPANGCGVAGLTMSQDWTPDIVQVDMTPCLDLGSMLQAIRVEPTGGSSNIALLRMRLTIYGAQF
jgi:hypothetical protein